MFRRIDLIYREASYFALMKARLLWVFCWLIVAFVPLNLVKLALVQPPAIPTRLWFNAVFLIAAISTLRCLLTGRLAITGAILVGSAVIPVNATLLFISQFHQPLAAAITLFVFNVVFLLIALVFASRPVAFLMLLVTVGVQIAFHLRAMPAELVSGSMSFAGNTLLRDGIIAAGFIFCLGITFSKLIEAAQIRGEEALAKSRQMNENLENVVSERTVALEAATARANEASRAKGEFLTNMSHEIRTPLHAVIASSELLLANKNLPSDIGEHVRIIADAGELLMNQIGDILDLSKIESGQVEIEKEPFALRTLISECARLMQSKATGAKVDLDCVVSPDLGEFYLGDGFRLRQVLLNLLSNAIKFTPAGGNIRLSVHPTPPAANDQVRIHFEVIDTGIGMDDVAQSKVFARFAQAAPSTSRHYGGTGLGLAICLHLVDLMGGNLTVHSSVNKGSTFSFSLPLSESKGPPRPDQAATSYDQLGLKVLVADDNGTNCRILGLQLERLDCQVEIATDGLEVLDLLQRKELPDVILMDCEMLQMDGWTTTQAIRAWGSSPEATAQQRVASQIPVIALTAATSPENRKRCSEAGMGGFLSKPVKLADLQSALREACIDRIDAEGL